MRKFSTLIFIFSILFGFNYGFWYFEDKVYCSVENQNVVISLKNENWTVKCRTYMDTIYQLAIKKYEEIETIRTYISQWDDVYYWKEVMTKKKAEFLQLVNYRIQIRSLIQQFESSFFEQYYNFLQKPMSTYYSDLETQYYILINQDESIRSTSFSLQVAQIEQQMWNVSHVLNAKNLDDIMEVVPSYIYLKKQIEWR